MPDKRSHGGICLSPVLVRNTNNTPNLGGNVETETVLTCPVCDRGSSGGTRFQTVRQHLKWDLLRCSECSFEFWYPLTQATREFFEETYKSFADVSSKPTLGTRHRLTLTHMPVSAGTILDIGCGDSLFLPEARRRGFDVWGVDFNRKVIEKNKTLFKLNNLFAMSVYDFALLPNLPKFDLITFFEVLEHVEDPKRFISTVRNLLKEDAFIALCLPDSKVWGPCERMLNAPPYHTAHWTADTLRMFLARNGFEIIMTKKIGRPDAVDLLMNTLVRFRLMKNTAVAPFKQKIDFYRTRSVFSYLSKAMKLLLRCVSLPLRQFLYIVGIRPAIYVIAQRKG